MRWGTTTDLGWTDGTVPDIIGLRTTLTTENRMKAFLAAVAASIVIAVGAAVILGFINTAVDEMPAVASVRLK